MELLLVLPPAHQYTVFGPQSVLLFFFYIKSQLMLADVGGRSTGVLQIGGHFSVLQYSTRRLRRAFLSTPVLRPPKSLGFFEYSSTPSLRLWRTGVLSFYVECTGEAGHPIRRPADTTGVLKLNTVIAKSGPTMLPLEYCNQTTAP